MTTVPVWVLLGFAGWTVTLLFATVGVYRWSRILTGRATIREWRPDVAQGSGWYQRAVRAHMNCVENLPVFGAVVLALFVTDVQSATVNALAIAYLLARVAQSLVHVTLEQTEKVAAVRFGLFAAQIAIVIALGIIVVRSA